MTRETVLEDAALPDRVLVTHVPSGLEAEVVAARSRAGRERTEGGRGHDVIFVARDGEQMRLVANALEVFAPELERILLPAWDCMPYDRASPSPAVQARRMGALAELARRSTSSPPAVLLTTANAIVQRVPSLASVRARSRFLAPGQQVRTDAILSWLEENAFLRTSTVREAGEYAVRGGIVDLFAPGDQEPVRLDFFGTTLESIRTFDPETQRSTGQLKGLDLIPMSEVVLTADTIRQFRERYVRHFGAPTRDDLLYHDVSEGIRHPGLEHWMPFFVDDLVPVTSLMPGADVVSDHLVPDASENRHREVADHYAARREGGIAAGAQPYHPIPPELLYLDAAAREAAEAGHRQIVLSPFSEAERAVPGRATVSLGGRTGRTFAAERASGDVNVFDAVVAHAKSLVKAGRRTLIAAWSEGSRDRLAQVLADHGLKQVAPVDTLSAARELPAAAVGILVLELETGFEADDLAVVAEQDILGDRLVSGRRRRKSNQDVITEAASLSEGDLVVHADHGIGRFLGLKTIMAAGAPHDCVELAYHNDDKLYLPVENIDLLTRYGSESTEVALDRLGGGHWQARKARMKKRIRDMADQLIKTAAARAMKPAVVVEPQSGLFDEFVARFPYSETEDQQAAIEAVLADLSAGRPMDRLVCGDVGFGKTEVALRAAFATAASGRQVAMIVPTTLLARQHYKTFEERFRGLPVKIAQASRLVPSREMTAVKDGLRSGDIDIVIGTHALLGKGVEFRDLALLIVDEEQHFGVKHKERLKELRGDVHVLTLSATPIPRTLQLALTGVRELSLIATPPIDRLAVRTFVSPFDPLTVREALLRERYRGGQSFYVCPRISDLAEQTAFLDEAVPEVKVAVAHGQMPAGELDDIMNAFYDGRYDVLLSTTIVESGLDIPTANTLIVHRADMFGLAQLYQLRGRVGRSKTRAFCLLTVPEGKRLTSGAEKRLKVLQSLDTLGAGFQLASHDLDLRGGGNLLGEEQSGHIKEVGYELYQQMLEEAVASLKAGGEEEVADQWSPQIAIGLPVMIPAGYIPDLQLRMNLYRRLGDLSDPRDIDAFAAELVDRFGPVPSEVEALLKVVFIKGLCRRAHVEKIDAGPKGAVLTFRHNTFPQPAQLVQFIAKQGTLAKLRPDHKLVLIRDWEDMDKRLKGVATIMTQLAKLAEEKAKVAA